MLGEDLAGLWTLVPYPRLPDVQGATNFGNMGGSAWYILDVPGYELAAEFLEFTFGNNLEFHEALLTEIGALSVFTPLANSPILSEPHPFFGGQPIFQQFSIWANYIPSFNVGLHTYFGNSLVSTAIVEVLEEGRDIDEALDAAQHHADTQLNN
jgi:lactose/L-arabinose transport system substrate-binding protein